MVVDGSTQAESLSQAASGINAASRPFKEATNECVNGRTLMQPILSNNRRFRLAGSIIPSNFNINFDNDVRASRKLDVSQFKAPQSIYGFKDDGDTRRSYTS